MPHLYFSDLARAFQQWPNRTSWILVVDAPGVRPRWCMDIEPYSDGTNGIADSSLALAVRTGI